MKFTTSDDCTVDIPKEIAMQFETLKHMIEDIGDTADDIPLPNIRKDIFLRLTDFVRRQLEGQSVSLEDDWVREFMKVDVSTIFELMIGVNYLNNKQLLDLLAKYVAKSYIEGKTVEQMRATFGVVNDFTAEEEAQIKKENEWIEV